MKYINRSTTLVLLITFLFFTNVLCGIGQTFTVKIGDKVTNFNANNDRGELWRLEDHQEKKFLIIYFYPASFTGG